MSHHASCTPNDRTLIWKCYQCGEEESAEFELLRKNVEIISLKTRIASLEAELKDERARETKCYACGGPLGDRPQCLPCWKATELKAKEQSGEGLR